MATGWKQLTRADLRGFDDTQTGLVLEAIEQGAVGRVSTRGHAILRAPDGVSTMSVAPNAKKGNRSGKNARAGVQRLLSSGTVDPVAPIATTGEEKPMAQVSDAARYTCDECSDSFDSLKRLTGHKVGAHFDQDAGPVNCPECGREFGSKRGVRTHMEAAHSGKSSGPRNTTPGGEAEVWACDLCPAVYPTRRNMSQHRAAAHREHPKLSDQAARARRQLVPLHREASSTPKATAARAQAQASQHPSARASEAPAVPQPQPGASQPSEAPRDAGQAILARLESQAVELAALRRENSDLRAALALVREALGALDG